MSGKGSGLVASSLSSSEAPAVRAGPELADAGSAGHHLGEEAGSEDSSQRATGTGWLLMGTGAVFSLVGLGSEGT